MSIPSLGPRRPPSRTAHADPEPSEKDFDGLGPPRGAQHGRLRCRDLMRCQGPSRIADRHLAHLHGFSMLFVSFRRLLDVLRSVATEAPADPQVGALRSGHDLLLRLCAAVVRPQAAPGSRAFV